MKIHPAILVILGLVSCRPSVQYEDKDPARPVVPIASADSFLHALIRTPGLEVVLPDTLSCIDPRKAEEFDGTWAQECTLRFGTDEMIFGYEWDASGRIVSVNKFLVNGQDCNGFRTMDEPEDTLEYYPEAIDEERTRMIRYGSNRWIILQEKPVYCSGSFCQVLNTYIIALDSKGKILSLEKGHTTYALNALEFGDIDRDGKLDFLTGYGYPGLARLEAGKAMGMEMDMHIGVKRFDGKHWRTGRDKDTTWYLDYAWSYDTTSYAVFEHHWPVPLPAGVLLHSK